MTAYLLPTIDKPILGITHLFDAGDHLIGHISVVRFFIPAVEIQKRSLLIKALFSSEREPPLKYLLTAAAETPASCAISFMVIIRFSVNSVF